MEEIRKEIVSIPRKTLILWAITLGALLFYGILSIIFLERFPEVFRGIFAPLNPYRELLEILFYPLYFLFLLLAVSSFTRSITYRELIIFFAFGATGAIFLGTIFPYLYHLLFDPNFYNTRYTAVPLFEEAVKILPIIPIALFYRHRGIGRTTGALDLMILAAAVGAGYGIMEDFIRGLSLTHIDYFERIRITLPFLGRFDHRLIFPDETFVGSILPVEAYIGHAAGTAFIGLGLGVARLISNPKRFWIWLLPLFIYLWVTYAHAVVNGFRFSETLWEWNWKGRLLSEAFLVFVLGTIIFEILIYRRYNQADPETHLSLFKMKFLPLKGATFQKLRTYYIARRLRAGLIFGNYNYSGFSEENKKKVKVHLITLREIVLSFKKSLTV